MPSTSVWRLRTPELTDTNNVPSDLSVLAQGVENALNSHFTQLVTVTTNGNGDASFQIAWPAGMTARVPAAVFLQDAHTSLNVGPIFVRWNVASTTASTVAFRVFSSTGAVLPNYPIRFAATITAPTPA